MVLCSHSPLLTMVKTLLCPQLGLSISDFPSFSSFLAQLLNSLLKSPPASSHLHSCLPLGLHEHPVAPVCTLLSHWTKSLHCHHDPPSVKPFCPLPPGWKNLIWGSWAFRADSKALSKALPQLPRPNYLSISFVKTNSFIKDLYRLSSFMFLHYKDERKKMRNSDHVQPYFLVSRIKLKLHHLFLYYYYFL